MMRWTGIAPWEFRGFQVPADPAPPSAAEEEEEEGDVAKENVDDPPDLKFGVWGLRFRV